MIQLACRGMIGLSIPSPPASEWGIFGVPIRAYALCLIAGIVVGVVIATRRWIARGGSKDAVETVAVLAVLFGIVGARMYHVITDHQLYFGPGRQPIHALYIWDGGLGIWGGVALGALGGYLVARRRNIRFWALADALAPGVAVAQAIGRLGNYFNQELVGRPTTLPWGLEISPPNRPPGFEQYPTFHPTFGYELLWDVGVAVAIILLDRKFRLGHGKVFMLYVMLYTAGRGWVEALRIDPAHRVLGLRINDYVSIAVFLAAFACLLWLIKNKPGREPIVEGSFAYVNGDPPEEAGRGAGQDAADETGEDSDSRRDTRPESSTATDADPDAAAADPGSRADATAGRPAGEESPDDIGDRDNDPAHEV